MCSFDPSLRAVLLGVANLGFYYCHHHRRTKFSAAWNREATKGEKLRASVRVWTRHFGLPESTQDLLIHLVSAFLTACWQEEDDRVAAFKAVVAAAAAVAKKSAAALKRGGDDAVGKKKSGQPSAKKARKVK